jgi:hypothetical protein
MIPLENDTVMGVDESIDLFYIDMNPLLKQTVWEEWFSRNTLHGIAIGVIDGWYPLCDEFGGLVALW